MELFAGVGGFSEGLKKASPHYKIKYMNQYEPSRKRQDAYEILRYHYKDEATVSNQDIQTVTTEQFKQIGEEHNINMIVGGFPCQAFSTATSSRHAFGIEGGKGVLFWDIVRAVEAITPDYLILENVDRLLKSPTKQRGRDFAIMVRVFHELGYDLEWRVINAAEYGGAQKRKRVFMVVYNRSSNYAGFINQHTEDEQLLHKGIHARAFPVLTEVAKQLTDDLSIYSIQGVSDTYQSPFYNAGVVRQGVFTTYELQAKDEGFIPLKDILETNVPDEYYLSEDKVARFQYLRGAKKFDRVSKDGHKYTYSEGAMAPHDYLDRPARTLLTSEGSVSRTTHFIKDGERYRLLTPLEAERIQHFPDNHTQYKLDEDNNVQEVSKRMRMFCMGNALVVDMVTRIAKELITYK